MSTISPQRWVINMRPFVVLLFCLMISSCSLYTFSIKKAPDYNRPSDLTLNELPHCNTNHSNFWSHVQSYDKTPTGIKIVYRRPISVSEIYRGDCVGDEFTCNSVYYELTDIHGKVKSYNASQYSPAKYTKVEGARIKELYMRGGVSGAGVDRQSGPIIACPL